MFRVALLSLALLAAPASVQAGGVCANSFGVRTFAVAPACGGFGVQAFGFAPQAVFVQPQAVFVPQARVRVLGGRRQVFRQSTVIRN